MRTRATPAAARPTETRMRFDDDIAAYLELSEAEQDRVWAGLNPADQRQLQIAVDDYLRRFPEPIEGESDDEEVYEERRATRSAGQRQAAESFALLGLVVAGLLWPIGARATIDGVIIFVNWLIAGVVGVGSAITPDFNEPAWWLLWLIPLGISRVEWRPPVRRAGKGWKIEWKRLDRLALWGILTVIDLWSTWIGLTEKAESHGDLFVWIAAASWRAAIAVALLTFLPETFGRMAARELQLSRWVPRWITAGRLAAVYAAVLIGWQLYRTFA